MSGAKLLSRESLPKSLAKFGPKFVGKCLGAQMMAYIQREGMKEGLGKEKEKKFKNDRYRLIYRNIRITGEKRKCSDKYRSYQQMLREGCKL